ncbi:MAG: hypothetical protein M5U07_08440 [Xanthobacteraceae bacterium]|nr:hypothetical protein [Xanthobacteraceae bacterium]PWB61185.1 MAG: hypothetical protein C3F17_13305 [Bradyrhizobiaceae bacterium]
MIAILRAAAQFLIILALFGGVAAFANWPVYRQTPQGTAVIMVTFVHGADRKAACRKLTPAEIAKLPPNMRRTQECPRSRPPLYLELDIDGAPALRATLPPTGIAGDGPSRVYERFVVPAGAHEIAVRMRDTPRSEGYDYERTGRVTLTPDQLMVVDFRAESGEFLFR